MFINWKNRELNLNVVYYGPALSGKTTNLEQIHARTNATQRSELFTLNTKEDRTLFFDFLQLELGAIGGLKPKFGLYTVPGQIYYEATREMVLRRADGLVFVVDSQGGRLEDNLASWQDMGKHLGRLGRTVQSIPVVVQYNKRDLSDALPVTELRTALGAEAFPACEASAIRGEGVQQTLQMILRLVMADVQKQLRAGVKQEAA